MPPLDEAALLNSSEKELRDALGRSARVYAPYLLLRSLQQWRDLNSITLPSSIRPILEATYAEPASDEPKAWRQLHEQLEIRRSELATLALSVVNVWNMPALPDEEGVQTRYNSYPSAQLLLACKIEQVDAYSTRVQLPNGDVIVAHERQWSFDAAKAIHRNLTRVPRWSMNDALMKAPGWLSNHVSEQTALALLGSDGTVHWPNDETDSGLTYQSGQGIVINRVRLRRARLEEWDESYD